MITRHAKKHPDAPSPPSPPTLRAPPPKSDSEEIVKLKKENERLRGLLKFHLGKDFS